MAFQPRVFEQILTDMVAYIRANTNATDFNIGSVIRTILEAAALEDDEQYHQMVQLLFDFRFATATGSDLDERAADFNLRRLQNAQAVGKVRYSNGALTTSALTFDTVVAAVAITIDDVSEFTIPGAPYNIRIGEGTANVEDIAVSAVDAITGIATVAALVRTHSAGDRVSEIAGSQQNIASGVQVQVPAIGTDQPFVYQAVESGVIALGDTQSNLVSVISTSGGSFGNVGASQITEFAGGGPFTGALVTNPASTGGGRDLETDRAFRGRIKLRIQALGRGTPKSIEGGIAGITDPVTGQRVVTAKLIENFTTEEHLLYIDDGTGFTPTSVILAGSSLKIGIAIGVGTITLNDASTFPASGTIIVVSAVVGTDEPEVLEYSSKTGDVLTLVTNTVATHLISDVVRIVDDLGLAEEGQNFFQATHFPARRNSIQIYDDNSGTLLLRAEGTDYFFNRTNGQIQYYGAGLSTGTRVVLAYSYYTGLFAQAQKVVNGDPEDSFNYPGLAAAGNIIYVDTPTIRTISIIISISVANGEDESEVKDDVQFTIENYLDSRTIGQDIILARIIDRAMDIDGVTNAKITSPTADLAILEEELPKSFDANGNSLVTVL